MIYKMKGLMYRELISALSKKGHAANEADVISYINQTFGLRGTIEKINLV